MVNVYAIVNRDIFGVPTHLPSPTHVSVPNVVIETREAKAHAVLRTVKKKWQVQETYKTFQSPQAECIHLKYPPRYYPDYILPCVCGIWLFWNWLRRTSHPINVRVLENGQNHQEGDELKCRAEFNGASPLPTSRAEEINSSPTPMWTMPFCLVSLTGQQGNNETVKFSVSFGT